jgi:hypothetical protein
MKAVGRAAGSMVDEVRRQFRDIPGIMEGTGKPDYATCVAISTKGAQREMMLPSLIAIAVPLIIGLTLGVAGVVGLLIGGMTAGFTLASMLNNSGGAWTTPRNSLKKAITAARGAKLTRPALWVTPLVTLQGHLRPLTQHPHQTHVNGLGCYGRSDRDMEHNGINLLPVVSAMADGSSASGAPETGRIEYN